MPEIVHSYTKLLVWQRAVTLAVAVYELTAKFPSQEIYGLTSQMRRCVVSISSNIAEGRYRGTRKDFVQFLRIASASGAELETQIIIAKQLSFSKNLDYNRVDGLLSEVMKMLNKMLLGLREANQLKS